MATQPSLESDATATGAADAHPSVERARTVSTLLDDAIRVPGTDFRVGLDPILGILPVGGDIVSAIISLYIVAEAAKAGAPAGLLGKMLAVVTVDLVAGSVPVVGVVFEVVRGAHGLSSQAGHHPVFTSVE
jgi:hypothetical protein